MRLYADTGPWLDHAMWACGIRQVVSEGSMVLLELRSRSGSPGRPPDDKLGSLTWRWSGRCCPAPGLRCSHFCRATPLMSGRLLDVMGGSMVVRRHRTVGANVTGCSMRNVSMRLID